MENIEEKGQVCPIEKVIKWVQRDPNTIDVNREKGRNRTCYVCGKWSYIAKNCWERYKKERVVEMPQESAKDNRGQ